MSQEIIYGTEYTVGAFFDNDNILCTYIIMKRKLNASGYTQEAEVIHCPIIREKLQKLGKYFGTVGTTNFQFIVRNDQLKLLEINLRISSSTSMRNLFGYNECEMGAKFFLFNQVPKQPIIKKGKVIRYEEEMVERWD